MLAISGLSGAEIANGFEETQPISIANANIRQSMESEYPAQDTGNFFNIIRPAIMRETVGYYG